MNNNNITRFIITPILCSILAACGGSSGGEENTDPVQNPDPTDNSGQTPDPDPNPTPDPDPDPTPDPTPDPDPTPGDGDAEVTVTIDLATKQYYGTVSELQRNKFINMHETFDISRNVPDAVLNEYRDEYDLGHGRQFWGPFSQGVYKNTLESTGDYPTEAQAISSGASNASSSLRAKTTNRVVITEHPDNPMRYPAHNDPVKSGQWAANYFQHFFNDETRPLFYEPYNEPFVHADTYAEFIASWEHNVEGLIYPGTNTEDIRKYITDVHNEVGKAFNARPELDNVNVLGFSSAWPSFEKWDFGHWESRMKLFIDGAGENVDAFAIHLYDGINVTGQETKRSGSNAEAILDLIETYSMFKFDTVKPHAITEYGNIVDQATKDYDPVANSQAVKTITHIMLELMEREDRLLTSIPFITGYTTWYWQNNAGHPYNPSIWRPNPDNIVINGNSAEFKPDNEIVGDKYLKTAKWVLLDFWKGIYGRRALVQNSDPDLQVVSFVKDDKAVVIMSNLEDGAKKVQLNLAAMTGYNYSSVKVERLKVPNDAQASLTETTTSLTSAVDGADLDLGRIDLDEFESVKYTFTLDKNIEHSSTMQRKTYYSDDHLKDIAANTAVSFSINDVDLTSLNNNRSTAMLKVAIGRAIAKSKHGTIKLNGTDVTMPTDWAGYDQANRDDFFGAIDVPIDFSLLQQNNTIEITFPDSGGKVSSVILEVNNVIDDFVVTDVNVTGSKTEGRPGDTVSLTSSVLPEFLSESVTWTSSDDSIATVDSSGAVTLVAEGSVTISATASNGVFGTYAITVLPASSNILFNLNSDFEQGAATDWITFWETPASQLTLSASAGRDSTNGLHLLCESDDNRCGISVPSSSLPQVLGLNQGRKFVLSMDIKVNNYVSGENAFRFDIIPGDENWGSRIHGYLPSVTSSDWTTVSVEFDEADWTGLSTPARFEGYFTSNGNPIKSDILDIYIDNISIEVVE